MSKTVELIVSIIIFIAIGIGLISCVIFVIETWQKEQQKEETEQIFYRTSEPKWLNIPISEVNLSGCSKHTIYNYTYTKNVVLKENAKDLIEKCRKEGGIPGLCYPEPPMISNEVAVVCGKKTVFGYLYICTDKTYLVEDKRILVENPSPLIEFRDKEKMIEELFDMSLWHFFSCNTFEQLIKEANEFITTGGMI